MTVQTQAKPTVVLVHGAWGDASGWSKVAQRLQADGYTVVAPANPLRGLSGDASYIANFLKTVPGPIVLVGHSYGGAVITNAATGNSNVKALVYVAAFAPDTDETVAKLTAKFPGTHLTDDPTAPVPTALNPVPLPQADGTYGVDLYLKPEKFRDVFLSDRLSTQTAAVMAATQRPATAVALNEPSQSAAWKTIPSFFLVANKDRALPPAAERYMAERAKGRTVAVNEPHAVHITNPGAVVSLINDAVRATD
ncbi:alpha/beta fold hydrolase [Streptomyces sp. NPDC087659]|uniref:alpha/beta fold hydrolase n=1 Tax=Streptomyces sp. NPDC087659 TaxID=3365801 RepID=UPI00381ABD20